MKLNQEKIQRMFNGQGSVAGGGGSSFDPSVLFGLATEQWTEENYVSKTFFNELFVIHKLTTTVVYDENDQEISRTTSKLGTFLPNELPSETETVDEETGYKTVVTTAVDNIEAKKGVWTNFFMSALGLNDAGGGGGVGDVTWDALEDDTDYRQIALSHLTTALQNYATQTWVQTQGYVTQSAISDMATKTWVGQQGFLTSSAISDMATKTWVGQQGYLTSSSISDMATKTWVGQQGFITSVTGTFWGRTFTNGGTVTGTLESVQHIQMTGHLYMHYGGTGIYLNSDGTGIDWHDASNDYVSSLLAFTSGQVQFNQDAYIPASKILRLGDAVFEWDSTNNAVKMRKATGANDAVNFYATGGVSALGYGPSGGGGTGDVTWDLLADNTDTRQIALSHLTTALSGYATTSQLAGYLPLTGGTISSDSTFRPLIVGSTYPGITEIGIGNSNVVYSGFGYNNGYTFIGREDGGNYPKIALRHSDGAMVYSPNNFASIRALFSSSGDNVLTINNSGDISAIMFNLNNANSLRVGAFTNHAFFYNPISNCEIELINTGGDNSIAFYNGSSKHVILHGGNYQNYALPLTGGTVTGALTVRSGGFKVGVGVGTETNQYSHALYMGDNDVDHMDFYEDEFRFYSNGGGNSTSLKVGNNTVYHSGNLTNVSQLTNDAGYTTNIGTVTQVKVGTAAYNPSSGVVSLPAYPSTLDDIADGSTRKLANYLPLTGGTLTNSSAKQNNILQIINSHSEAEICGIMMKLGSTNGLRIGTYTEHAFFYNPVANCEIEIKNTGGNEALEWYNGAQSYKVLHVGNYSSYALPLSGGTISGGNNFRPLTVGGTYSTITEIGIKNGNTVYSGFGYNNGYTFMGREDGGNYPKIALRHSDGAMVYSPNNFNTIKMYVDSNGSIFSSYNITASGAFFVGEGIELNHAGLSSTNGGYIDFHYNGSSRDYTTRIIENEENILSIMGISNTSSSAVRAGLKVGDGHNASYIQIGNIRLVYNDSTNSIRVVRYDGTAANLYATGGISALGISGSADGTVSASLVPSTTGTYKLGSSSYGWRQIELSYNSSNSYTGTISVDSDGINLISNNGGYFSGTRFLVNGRLVVNESDDVYPSYALYVNGNTYCDGSISASNVINRSDMRLKDVLDDLKLDLQTIANAPLFKFTFRKGERRVMVGTSAQYWQVLLPEAVFADADGMLGLDYGVTALASAISLAREVSEHDRRIAALEAENMVLRAEIKNLKAA